MHSKMSQCICQNKSHVTRTSFERTWIEVDSRPEHLGSLWTLRQNTSSHHFCCSFRLSRVDVKYVVLETKASLGLGCVYLRMCTCAQRHARCLIVSSNVLEIVEGFQCGSLTAWPLCTCWHLLGHRTQKLNINSLIASHLSHTRWVPSKENVTSLP